MKCLLSIAFILLSYTFLVESISLHIKRTPHTIKPGETVTLTGGALIAGYYFVDIQVGHPPQTFSVVLDTGSSNLVLQASANTGPPPYYVPQNSTTSHPVLYTSPVCQKCSPSGFGPCLFGQPYFADAPHNSDCGFGVSYAGGGLFVEGYYVTDRVCIGTVCADVVIGVVEAAFPNEFYSPGLLGLAHDANACNPSCVPTVLDTYVNNGLVNNYFSICLNKTGGQLDLGEKVASRYTGQIEYVPVEAHTWWTVYMLDVIVGHTSIGLPRFAYRTANDVFGSFIDSGTYNVLMGPEIFSALQSVFQSQYSDLLGVANGDIFNGLCYYATDFTASVIAEFPTIHFIIQQTLTKNLTLDFPPQSYFENFGDYVCFGIQPVGSLGVLLGALVIENYYVVFDGAQQQVGFAPLATC